MAKQATLRERFLREARTAAKLSHPNIIPIFSVEEVDEYVFFVMAYVQGETLAQRVREGPLKPDDATAIIREVAWALAYAHAQGVIHRDVKPDNILLEEASGRVLVTDFGIAHVADSDAVDEPAEILGTPDFMSPEQATGEPVDARSDIYSLGVTAFFAIAGRPPFSAPSSSELLAHHIRTPAPSLASVAPAVPRTLARVVERCMAKEPDERFQSGEALAEALAGTIVVKKETPVVVRLFVKQTKQWKERGYNLLYPLMGLYFGGAILTARHPAATVIGTGIIAASVAAPFGSALRRTRRVLKAGFEQADIVRAYQDHLGSLDEELRFLYGDDYVKVAKRWKRAAFAGIAGAALGITGMLMGAPEAGLVLSLFSVGVATLSGVQAQKRHTKGADQRVKFWRGRLGRWVCSIAGLGLEKKAETPDLTHRPTELAIGMAVSSLFESLPKAVRAGMSDLPEVVESLEADAQRLRDQINGLDDLLAVGETSPSAVRGEDSLAGQRQRAVDRIRSAREEAQRRFSDTVAALEKLRVDLLRMRAGSADVESVTANLGSARELGAQIDRLLTAHEEIEEELTRRPS
jgi:serine/threonine-protein kinase